jgi:cell pole-organizing protein PopZ
MSDAKSPPELSMEEILATIRRIIAEDEQAGVSGAVRSVAAGGEPSGREERAADSATGERSDADAARLAASRVDDSDDILELTEAINEDGTTRHLAPIGGASSRRTAAVREPAPAGRPEPELLRRDPAGRPATVGERLVSDAAARAAAGLTRSATDPLDPREQPGLGERTLEEIVTDLLRPLLQTWLDLNMPDMAERLVQAEISRIVGRSGAD